MRHFFKKAIYKIGKMFIKKDILKWIEDNRFYVVNSITWEVLDGLSKKRDRVDLKMWFYKKWTDINFDKLGYDEYWMLVTIIDKTLNRENQIYPNILLNNVGRTKYYKFLKKCKELNYIKKKGAYYLNPLVATKTRAVKVFVLKLFNINSIKCKL